MEYRGFNITSDGVFSYQTITLPKGGTLAKELRGYFTTTPQAVKSIDRYLNIVDSEPKRPVLKTKPVSAKRKANLK